MKRNIMLIITLLLYTLIADCKENNFITLENRYIKAVFNSESGALLKITDKKSGWDIMQREVLGQSFELLLPIEESQMSETDCRYNVIKGVDQTKPTIERSKKKITFIWKGLKSDFMNETADVTFKGEVGITDKGLEFSGSLINHSKYTVEYVSWPCIGEITIPDKTQPLHQSTRNDIKELFPHFSNRGAYWGIDYPTSTYIFPEKSFLQVNNRDRGFMIYNRALSKHTIITSFELIPGFDKRNTNPYEDEMDGQLVRVQFKANHVLYTEPGKISTLDPLQFVTYKGPWKEGLNVYRNDRIKYIEKPVVSNPDWLIKPLTWRKVGIKTASDLIRYAEESKRLGASVLLVNGWYKWKDARPMEISGLADAILKCHKLGLRIVLETNWTNVDRYADGYKEKLRKYVMVDPFGMPYNYNNMCLDASDVQQWVKKVWLSLPALHLADGYMNNDPNHNSKTYMCFDKTHGHRFGEPTINGMMILDKEMVESLSQDGKVALGQGFIESQNDIYDGYLVGVNDNFYVRHRYLAPKEPILTRVEVKNARRGMNKALLYRMNIVYDLYFYNDRLSDYPYIVEYGKQLEKLRNRYSEYVWNAKFDEHSGVDVKGKNIEYSVFINTNGKRTIVVSNMSSENATEVLFSEDNAKRFVYATPESLDSNAWKGYLELAPLSALVIMEQ